MVELQTPLAPGFTCVVAQAMVKTYAKRNAACGKTSRQPSLFLSEPAPHCSHSMSEVVTLVLDHIQATALVSMYFTMCTRGQVSRPLSLNGATPQLAQRQLVLCGCGDVT